MKNKLTITAVIVVIFVMFNPSPESFYYYNKGLNSNSRGTSRNKSNSYRKFNLLICSIYEGKGLVYLGILGNFIPLETRRKKVTSKENESIEVYTETTTDVINEQTADSFMIPEDAIEEVKEFNPNDYKITTTRIK